MKSLFAFGVALFFLVAMKLTDSIVDTTTLAALVIYFGLLK